MEQVVGENGRDDTAAGPGGGSSVHPRSGADGVAAAVLACPECGTSSSPRTIERTADAFCAECDFPLFWAPAAAALLAAAQRETDEALRRLPGAGGHRQRVTRACPSCGEHNPVGRVDCLRCGDPLERPAPAPVVLEPAPALPLPPPPPPPPTQRWFWPLLIAGLIIVTAVILALSLG